MPPAFCFPSPANLIAAVERKLVFDALLIYQT
jgi:hypothetical protein